MSETPTPIGVSPFMGGLDQMNRLPQDPVSVAIVSDDKSVFLCIQFQVDQVSDVPYLTHQLGWFTQLFLEEQGVMSVKRVEFSENE